MTDQPHNPQAAAAEAGPPLSAEEAQAEAINVTDGEPQLEQPAPEATPGEDVDSAEEAQAEAAPAEPDYKDLYLRASAEMENLRKRARRDVGLAQDRGVGKLARELLPAIDNLERALQAATHGPAAPVQGTGEAPGEDAEFVKGIRLVQGELIGAFAKAGIAVQDPKGQPFDPHRHEALAQAPTEGVEAGVVVEVYQPGYVLGETVLRAARVVVSS